MLRSYFVLIGGFLTGAFLLAALVATSASAGMSQDLSNCTAAKDRAAAAACTRVMGSGRLLEGQMYIGHFNRGTAYRSAGDPAKAIADFTRVLELKPGFARAYEARGLAQADRGDRERAMSDLDEAVKRGGGDWRFLYSRAVVLRDGGKREAALRDLDAAYAVKPDADYIPLMRALMRADEGAFEAARQEINRVLAKGGEDAAAHYARAAVAFQEGRVTAAESDVDRALTLKPGFAAARVLKGRIIEERGDDAAAQASYEEVLGGAPDGFDGRAMRRLAGERLAVLGKAKADKRGKDVADAQPDTRRPLDCKVFLPATGSIVSAKCSE